MCFFFYTHLLHPHCVIIYDTIYDIIYHLTYDPPFYHTPSLRLFVSTNWFPWLAIPKAPSKSNIVLCFSPIVRKNTICPLLVVISVYSNTNYVLPHHHLLYDKRYDLKYLWGQCKQNLLYFVRTYQQKANLLVRQKGVVVLRYNQRKLCLPHRRPYRSMRVR